jgi:hypothetical protein
VVALGAVVRVEMALGLAHAGVSGRFFFFSYFLVFFSYFCVEFD